MLVPLRFSFFGLSIANDHLLTIANLSTTTDSNVNNSPAFGFQTCFRHSSAIAIAGRLAELPSAGRLPCAYELSIEESPISAIGTLGLLMLVWCVASVIDF